MTNKGWVVNHCTIESGARANLAPIQTSKTCLKGRAFGNACQVHSD